MSVRVITGRAKGRRLQVPDIDAVRPTTDRARQVLFDILGDQCQDVDVLDLYAGSGALGIEAWSRGARSVTFVEELKAACEVIKRNLAMIGAQGTVVADSVERYLARPRAGGADLVFLDPPYAGGLGSLTGVLETLGSSGAVRVGGIIVVEAPTELVWPEGFRATRQRRIGGTTISFAAFDGYHRDLPRDV